MMKFTNQKECGDATSWYDVIIPTEWTVKDFIRYAVHTYAKENKEWGAIEFAHLRGYVSKIVEYDGREGKDGACWLYVGEDHMSIDEREKFLDNSREFYNQFADTKIISIRANGGWGVMDYILTLEGATNE